MHQSKIKQLSHLFHLIIYDIKKDIKTELIKFDYNVFQKLFGKTYIVKLSAKELADPIYQELCLGNEPLEEWVIARWVGKHSEIYQFFVHHLSAINPKFEDIKELDTEKETLIADEAVKRFGALKVYLFCILNGVAFSPSLFEKLSALAHHG